MRFLIFTVGFNIARVKTTTQTYYELLVFEMNVLRGMYEPVSDESLKGNKRQPGISSIQ